MRWQLDTVSSGFLDMLTLKMWKRAEVLQEFLIKQEGWEGIAYAACEPLRLDKTLRPQL